MVAVLVAGFLFVGLLAVALASGGGGESAGGLRLETSSPSPDGSTPVNVYLEDEADNVPGTARGRPNVRLRCVDKRGATVISAPQPWPFTGTDSEALGPHGHVTLPPPQYGRATRCLLDGTDGPLEGSLGARG